MEPDEKERPIESKDEEIRKERLLGMEWYAFVIVKSAKRQRTVIVVRHEWFIGLIAREVGKFHVCLIEKDCENYNKTTKLECKVDYNVDEEEKFRKYHEHDVVGCVISSSI